MSRLSLELPKIDEYPNNCVSTEFEGSKNMMYWKDTEGFFCKKRKVSSPNYYHESSLREQKISYYLKDKSYPNEISPPLVSLINNGELIIKQKVFEKGDLLDYCIDGNCNFNTAFNFLLTIRNVLLTLDRLKIIYGDFCLENFMITDDNKLTLIDFGCSEIFKEDKEYVWDLKKYLTIRPHFISPDLEKNYSQKKILNRDDIFSILQKKEMFSIGLVLYSIIFGKNCWKYNCYIPLDLKSKALDKLRKQVIESKISSSDRKIQLIYQILLNLIPMSIKDVIPLQQLVSDINELEGEKKRKFA